MTEPATQLAFARLTEARTSRLARDIQTLVYWLRHDVLALAGPDLATRRELFDFMVLPHSACNGTFMRRRERERGGGRNRRGHTWSVSDGVDGPQRHQCARVRVVRTCRRSRPR